MQIEIRRTNTADAALLALLGRITLRPELGRPRRTEAPFEYSRTGRAVRRSIAEIYVLWEFLRRRIGAELIGRVPSEAAARAPVLWLDVLRKNARAARFYEVHGFHLVGEDTYTIGGQGFTFDLMARGLP